MARSRSRSSSSRRTPSDASRSQGERVSLDKKKAGSVRWTPRLLLVWAGSFAVGITLMGILFFVLVWTTFLEFAFSSGIAMFAVYGSNWFALLLGLLGLNLFFAILLRWPWKYRHLPFLLAHGGVLILLIGCFASWRSGEEATLSLYEGTASSAARGREQCFEVRAVSMIANDRDEASVTAGSGGGSGGTLGIDRMRDRLGGRKTVFPFEPGPFSWSDYDRQNWFQNYSRNSPFLTVPLRWAMHFGKRDTGRLRSFDGGSAGNSSAASTDVSLEVVDYYANATLLPAIPLELSVQFARPGKAGAPDAASGSAASPATSPTAPGARARRGWELVSLALPFATEHGFMPAAPSVRKTLEGGERIVYYMTDSQGEVDAFRAGSPLDFVKAGEWGQVVLSLRGRTYHLSVQEMLQRDPADGPRPLGNSGYSVEMSRFDPRGPTVQMNVFAPNGRRARIALFADRPEMNVHARLLGLFGAYWYSPPQALSGNPGGSSGTGGVDGTSHSLAHRSVIDQSGQPRIDILHGPEAKLYYRYWTGKTVLASGEILTQAGTKGALMSMPLSLGNGTPDSVTFSVERFVPCDLPGCRLESLPVTRERNDRGYPLQAAKLRVNYEGGTEEFWIRALLPTAIPQPPQPDQVKYLYGRDDTLQITWNYRQVDLGFGLYLRQFEQKNEPGTRMAAGFSSLVDQIRFNDPATTETADPDKFSTLRENVLIRMNRPGIFRSPGGHAYRFYQSSRSGPYRPSDPNFWYAYDGSPFPDESKPRESIFISTFSVNYDPGNGFKYLGSFMLVVGTAWLIFRRKEHG